MVNAIIGQEVRRQRKVTVIILEPPTGFLPLSPLNGDDPAIAAAPDPEEPPVIGVESIRITLTILADTLFTMTIGVFRGGALPAESCTLWPKVSAPTTLRFSIALWVSYS